MGIVAATGLTKTFSFLAYTLPILGGIMADTKWGRFKTICVGTAIGAVAHIILVIGEVTRLCKRADLRLIVSHSSCNSLRNCRGACRRPIHDRLPPAGPGYRLYQGENHYFQASCHNNFLLQSCIAPIIADQSVVKHQSVTTLPSGERVIVDPGSVSSLPFKTKTLLDDIFPF